MKGTQEQKIQALIDMVTMVSNGVDMLEMTVPEMLCFVEGIVRKCAAKSDMSPECFLAHIESGMAISELLEDVLGIADIWKEGGDQNG